MKTSNNITTLQKGANAITLAHKDLRHVVILLRAVNHNIRKDIIRLLAAQETLSVTDIYLRLRIDQSVASQHLAILRRAHVVVPTRQGKSILYALNEQALAQIGELIEMVNKPV